MEYKQEDYKEFLEAEFDAQLKDYARLIDTKASVLKERGDVFVARFLKFKTGVAVFKIRVVDNMPRKNSFWTASMFSGEMGSFKNWGGLSWADLREKHQSAFSSSCCVWISKSDDPQFFLLGIKGLTVSFAKVLEANRTVVAFGPDTPPTKYYLNLLNICKENCHRTKEMLEYSKCAQSKWNPQVVPSTQDLNATITEQLSKSDCIAIQGPPGTGKTFRMARLTAQLLKQNNSVLVTALTNRALMELASKEDLTTYLQEGKVSKTSLTIDEHKEIPQLVSNDDNQCDAAPGRLSLATFYASSGWAKDVKDDCPFDYVIMDEASQALFPMIAATKKLGNKVIWIGDQAQLSPIIKTNEDTISDMKWSSIVRGFETLCDNFSIPSYMLSDTFRLTNRGAKLTGIFYDGKLKSVSNTQRIETSIPQINKHGGTSFVGLELKRGEKAPEQALTLIFDIVQKMLNERPNAEIAILSKFIETTKALQKYFVVNLHTEEIPKNLIIETVDKVQGLTVDFTVFFIPKASVQYSVEKELFNVATSRAKYCTLIVSDKYLLRENMPQEVRRYLLMSEDDKMVEFNAETKVTQTITAGKVGVTVVVKIDLPEKSLKEIANDKENIFVIDTNVFVKCPTVLSKVGKYRVVIPTTVLEELDNLKLKPNIDKKALNDAARNINMAFQSKFSHMEAGDSSILPVGFKAQKADCQILAVALKYKNSGKNAILLTSDNLLLSKALGLEITAITLSDFLKERRH